jgi:hypothetical protein
MYKRWRWMYIRCQPENIRFRLAAKRGVKKALCFRIGLFCIDIDAYRLIIFLLKVSPSGVVTFKI